MKHRLLGAVALLVAFICARSLANAAVPDSVAVPIIFNDHTVHTDDTIRHDRVLAALARGNAILVPLRAMLAQMGGARASYDAITGTVTIAKAGTQLVMTLGIPHIIIGDRVRPLDAAPILYKGEILVPLRVIAEGLGAYVQWIPGRRVVVIRYAELAAMLPTAAPATAAPATAAPVPQPSASATAAPTVTAGKPPARVIISVDYMNAPAISNEATPAHSVANQSLGVQGAYLLGAPDSFLVQVDFKRYRFVHDAFQHSVPCDPSPIDCATVNQLGQYQTGVCPGPDPGCVTAVGFNVIGQQTGRAQEYVNAFTGIDTDVDLRAALKILPHIYAGTGLYFKHYNYLGYPNIRGVGFGITKLPDLDKRLSLFGSAWYYPTVTGKYTYPVSPFLGPFSGVTVPFGYSVVKYRAGATLSLNRTRLFLEAGWAGEFFKATINAPVDGWTEGSFFGIGTRFP